MRPAGQIDDRHPRDDQAAPQNREQEPEEPGHANTAIGIRRRPCARRPTARACSETSGVMSTLEFFRDHAHASPSGRFAAPFTAVTSSARPQVPDRALVDRRRRTCRTPARTPAALIVSTITPGVLDLRDQRRRRALLVAQHRRRLVRATCSASQSTSQPVPRLCSITSTCARPSSRLPATLTHAPVRSGFTSNTNTSGSTGIALRVHQGQPRLHADDAARPAPSPSASRRPRAAPPRTSRRSIDSSSSLHVLRVDPDTERRVRLRPHVRVSVTRPPPDVVRMLGRAAHHPKYASRRPPLPAPAPGHGRTRPRAPSTPGRPPTPCTRPAGSGPRATSATTRRASPPAMCIASSRITQVRREPSAAALRPGLVPELLAGLQVDALLAVRPLDRLAPAAQLRVSPRSGPPSARTPRSAVANSCAEWMISRSPNKNRPASSRASSDPPLPFCRGTSTPTLRRRPTTVRPLAQTVHQDELLPLVQVQPRHRGEIARLLARRRDELRNVQNPRALMPPHDACLDRGGAWQVHPPARPAGTAPSGRPWSPATPSRSSTSTSRHSASCPSPPPTTTPPQPTPNRHPQARTPQPQERHHHSLDVRRDPASRRPVTPGCSGPLYRDRSWSSCPRSHGCPGKISKPHRAHTTPPS